MGNSSFREGKGARGSGPTRTATVTNVLQSQLREQAQALGAVYVGVADLAPARDYVAATSGAFLTEFPVGISIGVPLADGVVDQLYQHQNLEVARMYGHHVYRSLPDLVDRIATAVALQIERSGYQAMPIPMGAPYNRDGDGLISHKLVGHLAGLGWIGKNAMLITRDHGPRVRWITVLTSAPLSPTGTGVDEADRCKSCRLCVDFCPPQAFTGAAFRPADPLEVRFDREKCHQYLLERDRAYGFESCGLCIYSCPQGWSLKRKRPGQRTLELLRTELAPVLSSSRRSHCGSAADSMTISTRSNGR